MRMSLIIILLSLYAPFGGAQSKCLALFEKKNFDLQEAISLGVEIYDQNRNPYVEFQNVYFHATSVEAITFLRERLYLGAPVSWYPMLVHQFRMYKTYQVIHAYHRKMKPLVAELLHRSLNYAKYSAQRAYLSLRIGIPSLFSDPLGFELLEFLDSKIDVSALLNSSRDEDILRGQNQKWERLTDRDWNDILHQTTQRRGVVIVIDENFRKEIIVEKDPEDESAVALISKKGLPISYIKAIVPLSKNDRDEIENIR